MKKNYSKTGKKINSTYTGYVLYDSDLNPKYFIDSLQEIISLHDAFHMHLGKEIKFETISYEFSELHALDQVSFLSDIQNMKVPKLVKPASFQLIYFNKNLRGFHYQFNRLIFDESAIKKFILALEKQYFKGKYKQTGSSYKKWLEQEQVDTRKFNLSGNFEALEKVVSLDENLTKRVRQYIKDQDMSLIQFMAGAIGTYYKTSLKKDFSFSTNIFDEDISIIGNLDLNKSYGIKKNNRVSLGDFAKNDWVALDRKAYYSLILEDKYQDIRGQLFPLTTRDIDKDIEFRIRERDWEIDLLITLQKKKFNKDEVFLMLNKIRLAIYEILENDTTLVKDLVLLTKKERENALQFVKPSFSSKLESLYGQFSALKAQKPSHVALEVSGKTYTYDKINNLVIKLEKTFKQVAKGDVVSIQSEDIFDQVACFLAADKNQATFSLDAKGHVIKKGLFGYKTKKVDQSHHKEAQYLVKGPISRLGYQNYCNVYKKTLKPNAADVILTKDLYKHVLPGLLSGAKVVYGDNAMIDQVKPSIVELMPEEVKAYPSVKTAVVLGYTKENPAYQMMIGYVNDLTVPYCMLGQINGGRVNYLKPVDGIGMMILNKEGTITQAMEKGKIHFYGPGVADVPSEVAIDQVDFQNVVVSDIKGKWLSDGKLRV